MKILLEFTLPESEEEFNQCKNGPIYAMALNEFFHTSFKNKLKYDLLSEVEAKIIEDIRDEFLEILDCHNLTID